MNNNIATSFMASIRGFHDPQKHGGMTYEDFWELYLKFLKDSKKPYHQKIFKWIEENEKSALYLLTRNFHRTLHFRDDEV